MTAINTAKECRGFIKMASDEGEREEMMACNRLDFMGMLKSGEGLEAVL